MSVGRKCRHVSVEQNLKIEANVVVSECTVHCESKNWATFIFTVTLSNVGRF